MIWLDPMHPTGVHTATNVTNVTVRLIRPPAPEPRLGDGARRAVRKFAKTLERLADS